MTYKSILRIPVNQEKLTKKKKKQFIIINIKVKELCVVILRQMAIRQMVCCDV